KPALGFMRPFGCPVTILNTIDHLGKFDGKADEGFFVGYSINSKAFRVFNNRTRIVEENLHLQFSENTPNIARSTKACDDAGKARMETYDEKKVDEDPRKDSKSIDQEKDDNVNNTNNVNDASTNEVNAVGEKTSIELPVDPNMPALEDYSIFDLSSDNQDNNVEADMNNLNTTIQVSPNPTTRIHKDYPLNYMIRDLQSATQIRNMSKNLEEYRKRAIGTKWVFKNTNDKRGIMIKNKARLVYQGYTQEEGIAYDEVYVYQPPGFEDPDFLDRVYKVEKALYELHQAPKAWYETLSTYLLDNGFQRGKIDKNLFIRRDKEVKTASTPIETQKPLLKDEDGKEVDVHLYSSMISSLMYLTSSRPDIMFECKKQTVVANSTTEAEYVAASSCCRQVLWIQNQLLDYGKSKEKC
ncbi:retrovirus-related pol polyprotein from transposon TNT 1-94, partial [Tanacetum coccineum]